MEEKIANAEGHVDVPGHEATYPPGTKVYFMNGTYAGHEAPTQEETKATPEAKPKKIERR